MSMIRFARTALDHAAARKLRNQIRRYNLEHFGTDIDGAMDPELDGRTLCAFQARDLIGSIDVHWGGDPEISLDKMEAYDVFRVTGGAEPGQSVVLDEPMIHPDWKAEPIGLELKEGAARFALRSGARWVFSSSDPDEIAVHEALGFQVCGASGKGMPSLDHVPLVIDLHDVDHLRSVKSPLTALASRAVQRDALLPKSHDVDMELDGDAVWRRIFKLRREALASGKAFLRHIERSELGDLFRGAHVATFAPGEHLIRNKEKGRDLFVILQGHVTAMKDGKTLGHVSAGDVVGEMGFLREAVRQADVVAHNRVVALRINAEHLDHLTRTDLRLAAHLSLGIAEALCRKLEHANAVRP
jgi:CRP-like cAMP-binding protein